jgi:hypothetical protein
MSSSSLRIHEFGRIVRRSLEHPGLRLYVYLQDSLIANIFPAVMAALWATSSSGVIRRWRDINVSELSLRPRSRRQTNKRKWPQCRRWLEGVGGFGDSEARAENATITMVVRHKIKRLARLPGIPGTYVSRA